MTIRFYYAPKAFALEAQKLYHAHLHLLINFFAKYQVIQVETVGVKFTIFLQT